MFSKDILASKWRQSSLSSLKSVSSSVVTGLRAGLDSLKSADGSDKQTVTFVRFCRLEYASEGTETYHRVLLLGYSDGFQVWDLEDQRLVRELASKRDGAVRCLHLLTWHRNATVSRVLAQHRRGEDQRAL